MARTKVNPEPDLKPDLSTGYTESNRKTTAFYITITAILLLFFGNKLWGVNPDSAISSITQLAMVYIGGTAMADSVRYYKYGSTTLGNPEKQRELQQRYKDK